MASSYLLPDEWKLRVGLVFFVLGVLFMFELTKWKELFEGW